MKTTTEQLDNQTLNNIEYSAGHVELGSTPSHIIFCTNYRCNMQCMFCVDRCQDPDFSLDLYKNVFADKLAAAIKKATHLFYSGWGEVLLLPEIGDFLDYLNDSAPESIKTFTTNGVPLNESLALKLINGKYAFQVSLHTCDPLIHRLITHTDYFGQIVRQLKYLISQKKEGGLSNISLNMIFIANILNIENLPDFIDFSAELGADSVCCSYMTIYKPEHIKMSCYFVQDTTNRMFDEAQNRAKNYGIELSLPPRFGTGEGLTKIEQCKYPWNHLFIDALGNMLPCCYAGEPIGNLNNSDFVSVWNGNEYKELRKSLVEGRLHRRCKDCYKFSPSNVDDIRAHITFRPGTQTEILKVLGLGQTP